MFAPPADILLTAGWCFETALRGVAIAITTAIIASGLVQYLRIPSGMVSERPS